MVRHLNSLAIKLQMENVVREYTLLYSARRGFVSQPQPLGALSPRL